MKFKFAIIALSIFSLYACKETPKEIVKPAASADEQEVVTDILTEESEPKSTYVDVAGNTFELSDYKGKRILLNYWATWCKPCIEEMPSMVEAQTLLEKENYIFLLASDQSMEKIKAFQEKKKFDLRFVKFNGSLASEEITALPATFIYNEKGEKVERIDGATEWNSPEIIQKLKNIQ